MTIKDSLAPALLAVFMVATWWRHRAIGRDADSIDDQPEFGHFLDFLAKSVIAHPEQLSNIADLVSDDADLVEGVSVEA